MAWVKLDDQLINHQKIEAIGVVGLGLHVAALCYANQQLTDGFISSTRVPLLIDMGDVDRRWEDAKSLEHPAIVWAQVLVGAGVWEEVEGGYQIHDYLKYQPSRREVLKEREKRRGIRAAAGQQGGKQTCSKRAANVQQSGEQMSSPVARSPVPDPLPAAAARERHPDLARAIKGWERQSPGSINPTIVDALDWWLGDDLPIEWIERACEEAGLAGGRKPVRFVDAILRRYRSQGSMENMRPSKSEPVSGGAVNVGGMLVKTFEQEAADARGT